MELWLQVKWNGRNFPYQPLASILNTGINDATGITANCTITNLTSGTEVYNENVDSSALPVDSSGLFIFPEFDFTDNSLSDYSIVYTIASDSIDGLLNDNTTAANFSVREGIYSKAAWDDVNDRPLTTLATTISGGGAIEFYQGVTFPEAGVRINELTFLTETDQASLDGEEIIVTLSKWEDADGNNSVTDETELTLVGASVVEFDATATASEWTKFSLSNITTGEEFIEVSEAGARYFIALKYLGANTVSFGFDTDHENFLAFTLTGGLWSDADVPYLFTNVFPDGATGDVSMLQAFNNFGGSLAVGYYIDEIVGTNNYEPLNAEVKLFPNPSASELYADIVLENSSDELRYFIVDMNGKILRSAYDKNIQEITKRFDVSGLASGSYNLLILDGDKAQTKPFIVGK